MKNKCEHNDNGVINMENFIYECYKSLLKNNGKLDVKVFISMGGYNNFPGSLTFITKTKDNKIIKCLIDTIDLDKLIKIDKENTN